MEVAAVRDLQQATVGREIQKTFNRLHVLHFSVVKLIARLPVLEKARPGDVERKNEAEDRDIPES